MMVLVLDYLSFHVLCYFGHVCSWVVLDVLSVACLGVWGCVFACVVLSWVVTHSSIIGLSSSILLKSLLMSFCRFWVESIRVWVWKFWSPEWRQFLHWIEISCERLVHCTLSLGLVKTLWETMLMRNLAWGALSSSFALLGCWSFFPSTLYWVEANSIMTYFIYGHWRSLTLHVILNGRVIWSW